ncbi:MAG: hypothetical protein K2L83_06665 [Muribaculaceae bacterium]|nr:hypothetical protein [Muribaculaceae bacterium]
MSHSYSIIACLALALASSAAASGADMDSVADSDHRNPISIKRTTDVERSILGRHREDTVKNVPAPHFVVKSANNNFLLAIGGSLNVIMGGDIGNNLYKQDGAAGSFVTNQIPVPSVAGHKGDFFINPFNGYVDLQVTGLAGTPNEISGYIKVGTNGINSSIVLQRAYITYRGFQAGLQLTLMQDKYACQPPTIDPEGPCGELSAAAYEIAYRSKSYGGFRFAAAIDLPSYCSSNGYYRGHDYAKYYGKQVDTSLEQYVPDIPMWVEYSFSEWNRVRFSALIRNFHYRDLVTGKDRYTTGYGLMLSGNLSPVKPLIFYYQVAYGHGIGAYLQDLAGQDFSYVPDDDNPGKMKASPMLGAVGGLTYNATSKLQFNAMFSGSRIWDVADYATAPDSGCNYKYALYGAANCFYQLNSYLQFGLEYLWGRKVTWDKGGANDSRIQAQVAFTF